MSLELIDKPECPFCWKVRLALEESGATYRTISFDSPEAQQRMEKLNYGATFPVLFDGEIAITDSSIAIAHLIENYAPSLLPEQPSTRAKARTLEHYASFEIGKAMRKIVLEKRGKPRDQWNLETIEEGEKLWRTQQQQLAQWLGDEDYFAGEFSLAECALVPRFALGKQYGAPISDVFPKLKRWFEHQSQRPSFLQSTPWPHDEL